MTPKQWSAPTAAMFAISGKLMQGLQLREIAELPRHVVVLSLFWTRMMSGIHKN